MQPNGLPLNKHEQTSKRRNVGLSSCRGTLGITAVSADWNARLSMLTAHPDEDASLALLIEFGHNLVSLWRTRETRGLQAHPQLQALLRGMWPAAQFNNCATKPATRTGWMDASGK